MPKYSREKYMTTITMHVSKENADGAAMMQQIITTEIRGSIAKSEVIASSIGMTIGADISADYIMAIVAGLVTELELYQELIDFLDIQKEVRDTLKDIIKQHIDGEQKRRDNARNN